MRLAALITMDWLRLRLGENAPEEIKRVPEPSAYKEISDESLVSSHIHSGFVVDVVSIPERGFMDIQKIERSRLDTFLSFPRRGILLSIFFMTLRNS